MRSGPDAGVAVCLLAGGNASRFPGKLERPVAGVPLLLCTYLNVREVGPVVVSVREPDQAAVLDGHPITLAVDARPGRGPLEGLICAFRSVTEPWVFAVSGDAPYAGRELYDALRAAWEPHCEAVVPADDEGVLQPLCALYDRTAFLREAQRPQARESGAVRRVVEGLRAIRVRHINARAFFNVNTEADYRAANEGTR